MKRGFNGDEDLSRGVKIPHEGLMLVLRRWLLSATVENILKMDDGFACCQVQIVSDITAPKFHRCDTAQRSSGLTPCASLGADSVTRYRLLLLK